MDVERTIDFILKTQAKTEVRLGGITKLIQQGMRMLVKNEAAIAQLTEAQKRTFLKPAAEGKYIAAFGLEVCRASSCRPVLISS